MDLGPVARLRAGVRPTTLLAALATQAPMVPSTTVETSETGPWAVLSGGYAPSLAGANPDESDWPPLSDWSAPPLIQVAERSVERAALPERVSLGMMAARSMLALRDKGPLPLLGQVIQAVGRP